MQGEAARTRLATASVPRDFAHWVGMVVLAIAAQVALTLARQPWLAGVLYAAAVLMALGFRHAARAAGLPVYPTSPVASSPRIVAGPERRMACAGLLLTSAVLCCGVVPALNLAEAYVLARWIWLAGLLGALAAAVAWAPERMRLRWPAIDGHGRIELAALTCILLVAALLRLPNNGAMPPLVHGDEALFGLAGRALLTGWDPNTFRSKDNQFGDAITALGLRLFGDDLVGLRTGAAVGGLLSILALYGLVRRFFGARPALLAAWLLAVAQWHVHYSRDGITVMQAVVATVLLLYLVVLALDMGHPLAYVLLGFAAAACLGVYYPARLAPVLAAIYVAARVVAERRLIVAQWRGMALAALAFAFFVTPYVASALAQAREAEDEPGGYLAHDASHVSGRASSILVTSPPNLQHSASVYGVSGVGPILAVQTARTLGAFNVVDDTSDQYHKRGGLLDLWTSALLVPGIAILLLGIRGAPGLLITCWIGLTVVLGSVLTVGAPFSPRLTSVAPAIMVPPALVLDAGWRSAEARWGRRGSRAAAGAVLILLALILVTNIRDYLQVHITRDQPSDFYTVLGQEIAQTNGAYRAYVIGYPFVTLNYPTVWFIAGTVDGESLPNEPILRPFADVPPGKGLAFYVQQQTPIHDERLRQVQALYPGGQLSVIPNSAGRPVLTRYLVEHAEAVAATTSLRAVP